MYRLQELSTVTFVSELNYSLSLMNIDKKLFFLVGDINLDLLKLNQHAPRYDFYNVIIAHHLSPAITRPTRVTDSSATLIDNIFNNALNYSTRGTILFDDTSDLFPIILELCSIDKNSSLNN